MAGSSPWRRVHYFIVSLICSAYVLVETALAYSLERSDGLSTGDGISSSLTSGHLMVAGAVCVVVFVLVVVLVVPGCMDCMNSEVSSESHPACSETTHKWGGASGYTPVDASNPGAGFRTGETFNPNNQSNQPLPYSMVPTQIPEQGGFLGYQSGGGGRGDNAGIDDGLAGYNLDGRRGSRPAQTGPTHYNPMEPQEPPPPYSPPAGF